ncbi:hypothetical protein QTH97_07800 [Variovorax sp. J22R24]|uniref:hypothetical protein n=1 Tax=Variovorax gracilis TaxID=3053502 RepID=UPI002576A608|nr:hypothetical protein [Variovorax sp. J22R24]MDM0104832.1 hypothetical protein [Variovorax sp. J22R24]
MRSFKLIATASVVCLAFAVSGCHEHSRQSLARTQVKVNTTADPLDLYIGDKFSDEQRALASKPQTELDAPSF